MTVDIILLSNAKTPTLRRTTEAAIESCHRSEQVIKFNILVIEQNMDDRPEYAGATTIYTDSPFNYNKFMNTGISLTQNQYVCLCNNDVIFRPLWATNILAAMMAYDILSASPLCPKSHWAFKDGANVEFGYENGKHVAGWCIMTNRDLYKIIGGINDEFPFWFADNVYSEQLQQHGIRHALVRNSWVDHKGQSTLRTLENPDAMTVDYIKKFIEKYPENESAIFFAKQLNINP